MRTRKTKVEAEGAHKTRRISVATFSADGGTRTYAISQQTVAALMPLLDLLQRHIQSKTCQHGEPRQPASATAISARCSSTSSRSILSAISASVLLLDLLAHHFDGAKVLDRRIKFNALYGSVRMIFDSRHESALTRVIRSAPRTLTSSARYDRAHAVRHFRSRIGFRRLFQSKQ